MNTCDAAREAAKMRQSAKMLVTCFAVIAICSAAVMSQESSRGTISGQVSNPSNGKPWIHVKVIATDLDKVIATEVEKTEIVHVRSTDENGLYRLPVPPGTYRVSVQYGEGAEPREVTVPAGEVVENVDFQPTAISRDTPPEGRIYRPDPTWPLWTPLIVLCVVCLPTLIPLFRRRDRLGGVLISPGRTFGEIADRPDWRGPFFMILVYALVIGIVDFGTGLDQIPQLWGFQKWGRLLAAALLSLFIVVVYLVAQTIVWLLKATLLWCLARLAGYRCRFRLLFSSIGYTYVPSLLLAAITIGVAAIWTGKDHEMWRTSAIQLPTGLAGIFREEFQLFERTGNSFWVTLGGQIELFTLWSLGLTVIAVKHVYKSNTLRALILVVVYWIIAFGILVGLNYLAYSLDQMDRALAGV